MKNIVETAISAGSFNSLVTAVKAAGLVETLSNGGSFTVFAPTDEAFAKIPKSQLADLLNDKQALTKVLTYHVIGEKLGSSEVQKHSQIKTLEGSKLNVTTKNGVMINDAKLVKTDIDTSNGVIHVIDSVLMPK